LRKVDVDWNEAPLVRWLGGATKYGTRANYKSAFRAYTRYTGLTATQLLEEAVEDAKRGILERKNILKTRILGFYKWLTEEYPVYSRGSEKHAEHEVVRRGVREKTASAWVGAIRSFYGEFDLTVKLKGRSRIPTPRVYNKRMKLTPMDLKALVDHARSPRDRAIILTIFQGGMDVSTLCSMKYEDVAKGLRTAEHPLKVELFRKKSGTEYYTFLGRDAVEAIKAYFNDAKSRGIEFTPNTPLFVKGTGKGKPMTENLVQKIMREASMRAGLVDGNNNGKDMNPVSPHALRESFGGIMTGKGVDGTVVDFWLGHEIGEMAEAYKQAKVEDLKRMYAEREQFISITVPSIPSDVKSALEKQKTTVESLSTMFTEEKKRREEAEERIAKIEKAMKWMLSEIRAFQRETLKRMGESPEQIEEGMKLAGSKLEDYLAEET